MKCSECKAVEALGVVLDSVVEIDRPGTYCEHCALSLKVRDAIPPFALATATDALSTLPADEGQGDEYRRGVADAALRVAAIASFIAHDLPECAAIAEQVPTGVVIRELHKMIGIAVPTDAPTKAEPKPAPDSAEWAKDREVLHREKSCGICARSPLNKGGCPLPSPIPSCDFWPPEDTWALNKQWGKALNEIARLRAAEQAAKGKDPSEEEVERVARSLHEAMALRCGGPPWARLNGVEKDDRRFEARAILTRAVLKRGK